MSILRKPSPHIENGAFDSRRVLQHTGPSLLLCSWRTNSQSAFVITFTVRTSLLYPFPKKGA
jgi:hypothetical protein